MSLKNDENAIPGAFLSKAFEAATVAELKRWLKCRKASTTGLKSELVERCKIYSADPIRSKKVYDPDLIDSPKLPVLQSSEHPNKENIQDGVWTRSILGLSHCFGEGKIYGHLGGSGEKHRVAGYNMFKCGKVQNMMASKKTSYFEVKGIVGASYSKDRYKCAAKINNISGKITEGSCLCKAGAMGMCKHVATMLFQLNDYKQSGKEYIDEELACTDKPREWGLKKSRAPLVSKSFQELTFIKHVPEKSVKNLDYSNKRREYCSLPITRKDHLSPKRLTKLATDLKSTRSMWSELIFEHYNGESKADVTYYNTDPLPTRIDFKALLINGLTSDIDLESETVKNEVKKVIDDKPALTREEINTIEKETRGQSLNNKWFFHRKDRITASVVGEIVHRRTSTPPDALVSRICQYTVKKGTPAPCQHGIEFEAEARQGYINMCQSNGQKVTVEEVGLVVDSSYSWLGASVDGIIKVTEPVEDIGILEIKCPYVHVDDSHGEENIPQNLTELCLSRKNFYLTVDDNDNISGLSKKHNYYYQVQTQLGVLGVKWCDFMVYYKVSNTNICNSFVSRIEFDPELYRNLVIPKLYDFYLKGVVPEIITRRIKRGERLYPNSKNYVYNTI